MVEPFQATKETRYQKGTLPTSAEEREARRDSHATIEVPKCAGGCPRHSAKGFT